MARDLYKHTRIPTEKETERIAHFYFKWLYSWVGMDTKQYGKYWRLLENLHSCEFRWFVDNDVNRATDGIKMRFDFCSEYGYDIHEIDEYLINKPCSFLEMLIGLARRIDSDIMWDPEAGNRTCYWFWTMLKNAGFVNEKGTLRCDETFSPDDMIWVKNKVEFLVNREYDLRGKGGLFPIIALPDGVNFKETELWYQMQFYLNENFPVIDDTFVGL